MRAILARSTASSGGSSRALEGIAQRSPAARFMAQSRSPLHGSPRRTGGGDGGAAGFAAAEDTAWLFGGVGSGAAVERGGAVVVDRITSGVADGIGGGAVATTLVAAALGASDVVFVVTGGSTGAAHVTGAVPRSERAVMKARTATTASAATVTVTAAEMTRTPTRDRRISGAGSAGGGGVDSAAGGGPNGKIESGLAAIAGASSSFGRASSCALASSISAERSITSSLGCAPARRRALSESLSPRLPKDSAPASAEAPQIALSIA